MTVVHRVVDVEADNSTGLCHIYTRLRDGSEGMVLLKVVYGVIIGSDVSREHLREYIATVSTRVRGIKRMVPLGTSDTYNRGRKYLVYMSCCDYRSYKNLNRDIEYNSKDVFRCLYNSTLEDATLHKHGIYGAQYISVSGRVVKPTAQEDWFPYTPRIGAFDLEMLSLDPVAPDCEVYMASYCCPEYSVVIYTRRYCEEEIEDTEERRYVMAVDREDMMQKLLGHIADSHVDIVTGYNVYNADIPIVYYTVRRSMGSLPTRRKGPSSYFYKTKKMEKKYIQSDSGVCIKVPGTHVVDMYPYLEDTLGREKHRSMKLGDISSYYLGETKDPLSYKDLDRIYHKGTTEEKVTVMRYCIRDAYLTIMLYKHFDVWNYHSAMYSVCGVLPDRIMSKGMVEVTYGMCSTRGIETSVYMDEPDNPIFAPSGGLVLEPSRGYYTGVCCIDVKSMYPSIVVQHCIDSSNIRPMTMKDSMKARSVYYYEQLGDGSDVLQDSRGRKYVFARTQKALLPTVLRNLLQSRDRVKVQLKGTLDPHATRVMRAKEQAIKKCANSACGAYGQQTKGNPMSNCLLNDIITTTGRRVLSQAVGVLKAQGVTIIYGDTDSLMLDYPYPIEELIQLIHEHLPSGIRFSMEYRSDSFVMGAKKHYAYISNGAMEIKGYKGDKLSSCRAVQIAFEKLSVVLMEQGPDVAMGMYDELVRDCYNNPDLDIDMFSWKVSYSGKGYSDTSHKGMLISCMKDRGVELVPGNSLDVTYVMSRLDYYHKYLRHCDIELPESSGRKYQVAYTLEEIDRRIDLVDIEAIFDSQCKSVLMTMARAYLANSDDAQE